MMCKGGGGLLGQEGCIIGCGGCNECLVVLIMRLLVVVAMLHVGGFCCFKAWLCLARPRAVDVILPRCRQDLLCSAARKGDKGNKSLQQGTGQGKHWSNSEGEMIITNKCCFCILLFIQ